MKNKIKIKPPLICISCSKKIGPYFPRHYSMLSKGITGLIYAGFGSNYDGDICQISVCDDCMPKLIKEKKVKIRGNYLE